MAHRTLAGIVAGVAALAGAAPAHATLVYVRHPASTQPEVWASRDGGGHRHRLGTGTNPVVSPDGTLVAWTILGGRRASVWLARTDGSGRPRRVDRARDVGQVAFSPDGRLLGVALPRHLVIYDAASRQRFAVLRGHVPGFAFSPDSQRVAYALARSQAVDAGADLYRRTLAGAGAGSTERLTSDGRSTFPIWGDDGTIVFDHVRPRHDDAPVYQIWALGPGGGAPRHITHMRVPKLVSGLVPLELSRDGRRLLAEFEGQDTSAAFAVDMRTRRVRALSRRVDRGLVGGDLSADGKTVLGMSGGWDPAAPHDVVTVPFRGGRPTILVRNAASPSWNR